MTQGFKKGDFVKITGTYEVLRTDTPPGYTVINNHGAEQWFYGDDLEKVEKPLPTSVGAVVDATVTVKDVTTRRRFMLIAVSGQKAWWRAASPVQDVTVFASEELSDVKVILNG